VLEAEAPAPIVEEVVPEAGEPEPVVEEATLDVEEPELALSSRGDELLSQLKTRPRDYGARLELARLRYSEKDWDAALGNYEKLISARRFLPEVIDDLESLLEKQIEQARVYHMLGDAYMQQDRLDEALDMYRLARKTLAKR
jgi:tetratricopeptide (TPR) repeat protein